MDILSDSTVCALVVVWLFFSTIEKVVSIITDIRWDLRDSRRDDIK